MQAAAQRALDAGLWTVDGSMLVERTHQTQSLKCLRRYVQL